jgi:hypothetical protein
MAESRSMERIFLCIACALNCIRQLMIFLIVRLAVLFGFRKRGLQAR